MDFDREILERPLFKEPPGLMIYREFMIVLSYMDVESCGKLMQALFAYVLYGSKKESMELNGADRRLYERMCDKYLDCVEQYTDICQKNSLKGKKSAANRRKNQKSQT